MSEPLNLIPSLADFGVPRKYRGMRLADLTTDKWCEELASYCLSPKATTWGAKKWVVACAAPGRGKTSWLTSLFSACVGDKLRTKDDYWMMAQGPLKPIWVSEYKMFMTMDLLGSDSSQGSRSGYINSLAKAPLLMLDDIGVGSATDFKVNALRYIIDERYNEDRRTFITTTLKPEKLHELVGAAGSSRLNEMANVYKLAGPDKRTSNKYF